MNNTVRLLLRAKEILQSMDWIQKKPMEFGNGIQIWPSACCAAGAIELANTVMPEQNVWHYAHQIMQEVIYKECGKYHSVAFYNDQPSRTKEQMLALFDRAIQLASSKWSTS